VRCCRCVPGSVVFASLHAQSEACLCMSVLKPHRHNMHSNGNVTAFLGVSCAWQSSRSQLGLLLSAAKKLDCQQSGNRAWRHLGMTEHLISLAPKAAVASQKVCCWLGAALGSNLWSQLRSVPPCVLTTSVLLSGLVVNVRAASLEAEAGTGQQLMRCQHNHASLRKIL
jgi:hypothetical protein